ncbi:hypothetical protein RQP46_008623 [Phenoliferia psychrophenolica]
MTPLEWDHLSFAHVIPWPMSRPPVTLPPEVLIHIFQISGKLESRPGPRMHHGPRTRNGNLATSALVSKAWKEAVYVVLYGDLHHKFLGSTHGAFNRTQKANQDLMGLVRELDVDLVTAAAWTTEWKRGPEGLNCQIAASKRWRDAKPDDAPTIPVENIVSLTLRNMDGRIPDSVVLTMSTCVRKLEHVTLVWSSPQVVSLVPSMVALKSLNLVASYFPSSTPIKPTELLSLRSLSLTGNQHCALDVLGPRLGDLTSLEVSHPDAHLVQTLADRIDVLVGQES